MQFILEQIFPGQNLLVQFLRAQFLAQKPLAPVSNWWLLCELSGPPESESICQQCLSSIHSVQKAVPGTIKSEILIVPASHGQVILWNNSSRLACAVKGSRSIDIWIGYFKSWNLKVLNAGRKSPNMSFIYVFFRPMVYTLMVSVNKKWLEILCEIGLLKSIPFTKHVHSCGKEKVVYITF